MKLAVVQFCPEFKAIENNLKRIENYINNIEADLIVFPELSLSGYFFLSREESEIYALNFGSDEIKAIQSLGTKLNKIIVTGFCESEGDRIYNSAAILIPDDKKSRVYRKTHLFYKERFCFDEGDTGFFVIKDDERDLNLGTMICYDWRFPEAARSLALQGADLIVCPSNLITNVWHNVMPARALENKVYLAVANRVGEETNNGEKVLFNGESAIYGYNGKLLTKADAVGDAVLINEIFPSETRDKSFNEFNDIFKDRRPGKYTL